MNRYYNKFEQGSRAITEVWKGRFIPNGMKACADYSFVEGKSGLSRVLAFVCLFECP